MLSSSMDDQLQKLAAKKQRLDAHRPLPRELVKNLDEWFRIELTYTSNAIEGNTLTRAETALVVEKGITVAGKSLKNTWRLPIMWRLWSILNFWLGKQGEILRKTIFPILTKLSFTKRKKIAAEDTEPCPPA